MIKNNLPTGVIEIQVTDHFGGPITVFKCDKVDVHKALTTLEETRLQMKDPKIARWFPLRGKHLRLIVDGAVCTEEHFKSTYEGIS
jgi:hypothetical protein